MQRQEDTISVSVFEAAIGLHESLDAGEVIEVAMRVLPEMIQAESWAVFLKAEHSERLEMVRAINASALLVGPFVDIGAASSLIVRAVTEQKTLVTSDERATLCVPLMTGDRLIGAVQATRAADKVLRTATRFSSREIHVVEIICKSLASALANAIDYHNATRQTLIDDLTRLYNVRYLYQTLDTEMRRARRYGSPVSVVFMDLDGFKMVNDLYGHHAGSATLTEVAQVITLALREADFVARYGGDEFVLMLPETPARQAIQVAERVRSQIEAHKFTGGIGADIHLTASFGIASFPDHATGAEKLIELADGAMYEAKQQDKNSVRLAKKETQ